jgi:O-acetyl-ADP-ribose deacetylase (regulator of RNase III)
MNSVTIVLQQGDILQAQTAAIAYPADSAGRVGEATVADHRITAPTMQHANEPIPPKQVELATVAALRCADEHGFTSVALPPFGTTVGAVDLETAAKIMMETVQMFRSDQALQRVEIWLPTAEVLEVFKRFAAL